MIVRRVSSAESDYDDAPPTGGGSGCLKILGGLLVIIVVLIVGIAIVTFGGLSAAYNGVLGLFTSGIPGPPPQAAIVSTQTVVTSIQSMGQLVSISEQLAKADIDVSITQGFIGASSFTASHVAQGAVDAGIDLTGLTDANVRYDPATNTYTVALPRAQLTSCRVEYIRQYASTVQLLPVDRDEARVLAQYTALVEFRDDALEGGILDRAEQQAALVFGNLVDALTGGQTQITFIGERPVLPPSCEPDIPGSWIYDPATQTWTQPE